MFIPLYRRDECHGFCAAFGIVFVDDDVFELQGSAGLDAQLVGAVDGQGHHGHLLGEDLVTFGIGADQVYMLAQAGVAGGVLARQAPGIVALVVFSRLYFTGDPEPRCLVQLRRKSVESNRHGTLDGELRSRLDFEGISVESLGGFFEPGSVVLLCLFGLGHQLPALFFCRSGLKLLLQGILLLHHLEIEAGYVAEEFRIGGLVRASAAR